MHCGRQADIHCGIQSNIGGDGIKATRGEGGRIEDIIIEGGGCNSVHCGKQADMQSDKHGDVIVGDGGIIIADGIIICGEYILLINS